MICVDGEGPCLEEMLKVLDCFDNGKQFSVERGVVLLGGRQLSTEES